MPHTPVTKSLQASRSSSKSTPPPLHSLLSLSGHRMSSLACIANLLGPAADMARRLLTPYTANVQPLYHQPDLKVLAQPRIALSRHSSNESRALWLCPQKTRIRSRLLSRDSPGCCCTVPPTFRTALTTNHGTTGCADTIGCGNTTATATIRCNLVAGGGDQSQ
jgi:hypothetical protein